MSDPKKVALFVLEKEQKDNKQKNIDEQFGLEQTIRLFMVMIYSRDLLLWNELKKLDGIPHDNR